MYLFNFIWKAERHTHTQKTSVWWLTPQMFAHRGMCQASGPVLRTWNSIQIFLLGNRDPTLEPSDATFQKATTVSCFTDRRAWTLTRFSRKYQCPNWQRNCYTNLPLTEEDLQETFNCEHKNNRWFLLGALEKNLKEALFKPTFKGLF